MRIQGFTPLMRTLLEPYKLENTTVVVDGQNIFYSLYEKSSLPFVLGSECDRFADYVRQYLQRFKKKNFKCLFIMKGGHPNQHFLDVHYERNVINGENYVLGKYNKEEIIQPLLAKDVFIQVLDEMGFDYTVCDTSDVIKVCFDLANRLSCPVVSFNVQYCFSPVPYIPILKGHLGNVIFKRDEFLKKYNITLEKMILFIILTDNDIFDESIFLKFFERANVPQQHIRRYKTLLNWLSRKSVTDALKYIFKYISVSDQAKFVEAEKELEMKYLSCDEVENVASLYFTDRRSLDFIVQDPLWFQKGIALKYIAIPYINLYSWDIVLASRLIEDCDQENTIICSMDIIKYSYDLLKNFNGEDIKLIYRSSKNVKTEIRHLTSCSKPEYTAVNCVFENGWNNIDSLRIFKHFFLERLGNFDFDALEAAPEDFRLLLIAMVYFTDYKTVDVKDHVCSIMLSYVLLSVIANKIATIYNRSDIDNSLRSDSKINKDSVTLEDCKIAQSILQVYHNVSKREILDIFSRTKVHPLIQFEQCLQQINYLNQLCGFPYTTTPYSKCYSASFVYKFLGDVDSENVIENIKEILSPAPSVLAFTLGIIEIYKQIMNKLYV